MPLEPLYRLKAADGKRPFVTRREPGFEKLSLDGVAFLAVVTNVWPNGLAPVFAVEKGNRIELRRRPGRGQENFTEPLFFALAPEDEPDATRLAGRWEVQAVRGSGSTEYLAWELAVEGDEVSGRFDQDSQYRFAYIVGGTFHSNRLELRVEYNHDAYLLSGEWREGGFRGAWRQADDGERGTWQAGRTEVRAPPARELPATVRLYEWRRASDDARQYALEGERMEAGWERSARPLCRVWRGARSGAD
jgi:hypothetical protein